MQSHVVPVGPSPEKGRKSDPDCGRSEIGGGGGGGGGGSNEIGKFSWYAGRGERGRACFEARVVNVG